MAEQGLMTEVFVTWDGTETTADAGAGNATITVLNPTEVSPGDVVWLAGVDQYVVTTVDYDTGVVGVTPVLAADYEAATPVVPDMGGQPGQVWQAEVLMPDNDQPIAVPLPWQLQTTLVEGALTSPMPITLSDDLSDVLDFPGQLAPSLAGALLGLDAVEQTLVTVNADLLNLNTVILPQIDAALTQVEADVITAQSTADGKNTVTYSTNQPGAAANRAGDIWFRYSGTVITEQWKGNGGNSWTQVTIDGTLIIANIDAGAITAGFLDAARIAAGSISATKLSVKVGGDNLALDSSYESTGAASGGWINNGGGTTIVKDATRQWNGTQSLKVTPGQENWGYYGMQGGTVGGLAMPTHIVGETYTASVYVNTDSAQTLCLLDYGNSNTQGAGIAVQANTWTRLSVTFVAGTNVFLSVRRPNRTLMTGNTWLDGFMIQRADLLTGYAPNAAEILPGTILGTMIHGETITGDLIAARTIGADRIVANSLTAGEIAANTITGDRIAARTITANLIALGATTGNWLANAGFESGVLAPHVTAAGSTYTDVGANVRSGTHAALIQIGGTRAAGAFDYDVIFNGGRDIVANALPVKTGEVVTGELYVRDNTMAAGAQAVLYLEFFNPLGQIIQMINSSIGTFTASYQRLSVSAPTPPGASYAQIAFAVANCVQGNTCIIDDVSLAKTVTGTLLTPQMVLSSRLIASGGGAGDWTMLPPTSLTKTGAGAGGTLAATLTYLWVVTAVTLAGETRMSNEITYTLGAAEHSVTMTWQPVVGAITYRLYRRISVGARLVQTVTPVNGNVGTQTFTDTGAQEGVADPPSWCRTELNTVGLQAFGAAGNETVRIDAATGNASFIGEIGTALPGSMGVFMFSIDFTHFGAQKTQPVVQFNVNTTRDQPSIQSDNVGNPNLALYSGANTGGRETQVYVGAGLFQVGIEQTADDQAYSSGARIRLARDDLVLTTDGFLIGVNSNNNGVLRATNSDVFCGWLTAGGNLRGFRYIPSGDQAMIYSANEVLMVSQTGGAYQDLVAQKISSTSAGMWMLDLAGGGSTGASIGDGGRINRTGSSVRYKDDIEPLTLETAKTTLALRPVTFRLKEEAHMERRPVHAGFTAEQADEVGLHHWVTYDRLGRPDGFRYGELTAAHALLIADLYARLTTLEGAHP